MNFPIYAVVIAAICAVAIIVLLFIIKRKPDYKIVGTMHIDTSRDDKDICLFTLDMPLEDIQKERYVIIRIDGASNLKEWTK